MAFVEFLACTQDLGAGQLAANYANNANYNGSGGRLKLRVPSIEAALFLWKAIAALAPRLSKFALFDEIRGWRAKFFTS